MDIQSTLKQHRDYYWDELYRINLAKDAINVAYYKKDSISSSSHEDSLDYFDLMKIDRLSKVDYIDNLLLHLSDNSHNVFGQNEYSLNLINNEELKSEVKSILMGD